MPPTARQFDQVSGCGSGTCGVVARTMLIMVPPLSLAGVVDRLPHPLGGGWHVDMADAELAERVDQGIHHRRQRAGAAGFAATLGAERVGGRRDRMEFVQERRRVV